MRKALAAAALLLCAAPLFLSARSAAEETGEERRERLSFISVNDTLPPELVNTALSENGATYVPYTVFADYDLGIDYTYFIGASTAYLGAGEKQLFFDLNTGETYDGEDNRHSGSGVLRGGTVYLPLGTVCGYFDGLSYSFIAGNEYGSILRVTTEAAVLTDGEFLRAARSTMRSYYQNREAAPRPEESAPPAEEPGEETHEGDRMLLSFTGVPDAMTLDVLAAANVKACFFLTAEDVRAGADLIRRASGEGHSLGVWCEGDPAADHAKLNPLLFEAARVRTVLAAGPASLEEGFRARAEEAGMLWLGADLASGRDWEETERYSALLPALLENTAGDVSLRLRCGGDAAELQRLIEYLREQRFELVCPRET